MTPIRPLRESSYPQNRPGNKGFLRRFLAQQPRNGNAFDAAPRERARAQKPAFGGVEDVVILQEQAYMLPVRGDIKIAHNAYEQAALTGADVEEVKMGEQYSFHFVYPRTPETGRKYNREA